MEPLKIPKYYTIEKDIVESIKAGRLKPGDLVESESALKKKYNVSTITVRKAFSDLINEGYLIGVQGKGTFVAKKSFNRGLTSLSFKDELLQQGYQIDLVVDEICQIESEYFAEKLNIEKDSPITKIARIRIANGEVMAFQTSYISSDLLSVEQAKKIYETKSFYKTLEFYNLNPEWASETYSVKEINDLHICKMMNIKKNSATFCVKRIAYNEHDKILEYAESYFNKDSHTISVIIKR